MGRSNTQGYRQDNACYFDRNGLYMTTPETLYAADWGVILTLRASDANGMIDWIFQVWFKTSGEILGRRSINTGSHAFTDWKHLLET